METAKSRCRQGCDDVVKVVIMTDEAVARILVDLRHTGEWFERGEAPTGCGQIASATETAAQDELEKVREKQEAQCKIDQKSFLVPQGSKDTERLKKASERGWYWGKKKMRQQVRLTHLPASYKSRIICVAQR